MELTPEERRKIYEEEKAKLQTTPSHGKQKKTVGKTRNQIGCAVLLLIFGLAIYGAMTSGAKNSTTPDLSAAVVFDGSQFRIMNNDTFDWEDTQLEVNSGLVSGGYILKAGRLKAGGTYTVGCLQFAKEPEGTRLNPFTTKPQNMTIWAKTPKGKGIYTGEFK